MMNLLLISGIIIIIVIFIIVLISIITKTSSTPQKGDSKKTEYKYQKQPLLTNNELKFYRALIKTNIPKNFIIFSKVRLADLIEPIKGTSQSTRQSSFNKIKSKHIDFVLCDKANINPLLVIELDDNSHDRADRQERDNFVDQALKSAGLPILHTRSADRLEENIMALISPKKETIKK